MYRCGDPQLQERERWISSIHPGYRIPLAMQERAMFPRLCGAENLIRRYRTECFQLTEPEWMETAECGASCPRLPGLPHGLTRYVDGWRCYRCGAQPFWPLHECQP